MVKKITPPPDKATLNASEACGYLDICWKHLKALLDDGQIRFRRVGRRYIFTRAALDDFLEADAIRARALLQTVRR